MTAGRTALVVCGVIVGFLGVVLFAAGGGLLWAQATQSDAHGYLTGPAFDLETDGYAVTADDIDIVVDAGTEDWVPAIGDIRARVTVTPEDEGGQVFVGVARAEDLRHYLTGVPHARVERVDAVTGTRYVAVPGDAPPAPPAGEDFWVASTQGGGTQTLEWDAETGRWAVAVLNADGSAGIDAEATTGVRAAFVTPAGITLVLSGLVLSAVAAGMLLVGLRRPPVAPTPPTAPRSGPASVPAGGTPAA